jgi:hypothetical protein
LVMTAERSSHRRCRRRRRRPGEVPLHFDSARSLVSFAFSEVFRDCWCVRCPNRLRPSNHHGTQLSRSFRDKTGTKRRQLRPLVALFSPSTQLSARSFQDDPPGGRTDLKTRRLRAEKNKRRGKSPFFVFAIVTNSTNSASPSPEAPWS